MKNIAMLVVAMILISVNNNLNAQKKVNIDYAVTKAFGRQFKDASQVQWSEQAHDIFMARFTNDQDHCIAYFTSDGELILTGRKISFGIIPLIVRKRAEEVRALYKTKSNELTMREIYELAGDGGTEYFINLTSETLALSIIVYGNGTSRVLKKSNLPSENEGTPLLAADRF